MTEGVTARAWQRTAPRLRVVLLALHFAEYAASLAQALAAEHEVLLVLSERNAVAELGGTQVLAQVPNLRVVALPHRVSPTLLVANVLRIVRLVRAFRPDVIHCQEELKDYLIGALPLLPRVPFVLTVHDPRPHLGSDTKRLRWSRRRFFERWIRHKADHVIVHGLALADSAAEVMPWARGRIHVLPHGPLGELLGGPPRFDWEPGNCLFFGRIEDYKGLKYFIEAIRLLRRRGHAVRGVIAGRGPSLDALKPDLAGDEGFVVQEGFLSVEEVTQNFNRANLVVLPYVEATQSGVAAYALGRGRPLVVTDVGSLAEMVRPGQTGLVVPPRDAESLASAIARIVDAPELGLAMAREAASLGRGELSWKAIAAGSSRVYRSALAGNSR